MKETIETIIAWHKETFPLADTESQVYRFEEELREFLDAVERVDKLEEAADILISLCGVRRFNKERAIELYGYNIYITRLFADFSGTEISEAVHRKMQKNRKRSLEGYWAYDKQTQQYVARHKLNKSPGES